MIGMPSAQAKASDDYGTTSDWKGRQRWRGGRRAAANRRLLAAALFCYGWNKIEIRAPRCGSRPAASAEGQRRNQAGGPERREAKTGPTAFLKGPPSEGVDEVELLTLQSRFLVSRVGD